MNKFELFCPSDKITCNVSKLSNHITQFCSDQEIEKLHVIGLAKAALPFMMDLCYELKYLYSEYDIIRPRSYKGTEQNKVVIEYDSSDDIQGKDILLVDTICDTGRSLKTVSDYLYKEKNVGRVFTVVLFKKLREDGVCEFDGLSFVGEECPDKFLVGYGLDMDGKNRNWEDVYTKE